MSTFNCTITKALNDYKQMLRSHLGAQEKSKKIKRLGIDRRTIRSADDVALYHYASKILKDIEFWRQKEGKTPAWHSGLDECYKHISGILSEYQVTGKQVINSKQIASRAIVEAVQYLSQPPERLSDQHAKSIDNCSQRIATHGASDQQKLYEKQLKKLCASSPDFFKPRLVCFRGFL